MNCSHGCGKAGRPSGGTLGPNSGLFIALVPRGRFSNGAGVGVTSRGPEWQSVVFGVESFLGCRVVEGVGCFNTVNFVVLFLVTYSRGTASNAVCGTAGERITFGRTSTGCAFNASSPRRFRILLLHTGSVKTTAVPLIGRSIDKLFAIPAGIRFTSNTCRTTVGISFSEAGLTIKRSCSVGLGIPRGPVRKGVEAFALAVGESCG